MRPFLRTIATPLFLAVLVSCDSDSGPPSGPSLVGPCIHTYEDEVLHIDDAAGTDTGAVIVQLDLSEISVDGEARAAMAVVEQRAFNIVQFDGILRCTLPCSFGTESGLWEFTASAIGFTPTRQAVSAEYATFSKGCPSFETDGTRVSLLIDE